MDFIRGQNRPYFSWDFEFKIWFSGPLSYRVFRETGPRPGRRRHRVLKAWKPGVFGLHAGQCVCGLKMNKLIGRTSHRLCTFSTSIREIREIKYYFNIWGGGGVKIHPFHLPWIRASIQNSLLYNNLFSWLWEKKGNFNSRVLLFWYMTPTPFECNTEQVKSTKMDLFGDFFNSFIGCST